MSRRGSACLALIGLGALASGLAATSVAAQAPTAATAASGMRSTFDDTADPAVRPLTPPWRARSTPSEPVGQLPSFLVPPGRGAGKTGFISTKTKAKAKKRSGVAAKTAPAPAPTPPLLLSPSSLATTVERGTASPERAAAGEKPAATPASSPAKPATPPQPPAVAARAQAREALNTLPNTVVAVPRRPAEEDPYAQLGMRAGAFVLRPALEATGGYDSNPGRTVIAKGSAFATPAAELHAASDWERHALTADFRGSYTAYEATPELDVPYLDLKGAGRVDVTDRTRALVAGRYLMTSANPGTPDLPAGLAKLPIQTIAGATAGIAHRWNRFELALNGAFDRDEWGNSTLTDGTILSNKDRNYNQYAGNARAGYELWPGVKPFVDVVVDTRVHDAVDPFGVSRDSDGVAAKGGTSFEISRKLTGEAAIGYLVRTYKDPTLPDMRGVLFDGSLVWAASGLTTVKLVATTTPQETTLPGVSGLLSYDAGIQVDHAFRRWLIGTARLAYGIDDFVGSIRQDTRYGASAALTYRLTRTVQVKGEVRQEWRRSNVAGNDYDATIGMLGLRWQP